MNIKLNNIFPFFRLPSSNLKSFVANKSFDEIALVGIFSFISSGNSEPTTVLFVRISYDLSIIIFVIFQYA